MVSCICSGASVPSGFGHDHGVVLRFEAEVGPGIDERMPAAVDREQRGSMLDAEPGRDLVDREPEVRVGQRDPVELGPFAARDDVGHEARQARVQRRSSQQVRRDLRGDQQLVHARPLEVRFVARVVDLGHGPHARRHRLDGHDGQDRVHVRVVSRNRSGRSGRRRLPRSRPGRGRRHWSHRRSRSRRRCRPGSWARSR